MTVTAHPLGGVAIAVARSAHADNVECMIRAEQSPATDATAEARTHQPPIGHVMHVCCTMMLTPVTAEARDALRPTTVVYGAAVSAEDSTDTNDAATVPPRSAARPTPPTIDLKLVGVTKRVKVTEDFCTRTELPTMSGFHLEVR
jgi:hypothetical protein